MILMPEAIVYNFRTDSRPFWNLVIKKELLMMLLIMDQCHTMCALVNLGLSGDVLNNGEGCFNSGFKFLFRCTVKHVEIECLEWNIWKIID